MSIISTTHTVTAYESGKTKSLDGQRLAKVTYKTDKATKVKPASKSVSIPVLGWNEIKDHVSSIKDAIVELVQKEQDSIVRAKVEAGATSINDEDISIQAVIASMLETSSGRMTGDSIREWFKDGIRDNLLLAFASKLGIADDAAPSKEQSDKLEKILKGYEDSFAKLASGAASFNDTQKAQLIKAMQLADDSGDPMVVRFTERLSKKSDDDSLMSL